MKNNCKLRIGSYGEFNSGAATRKNGAIAKSYNSWKGMLKRCYSEKYHIRNPSYIGCSVCDEWLDYAIFKEWYESNYINGYHLDKDLIIKGNKVYSQYGCRFIPMEINNLIVSGNNKNGMPKGVRLAWKGSSKFRVSLNVDGKCKDIGYFNDKESAFGAYKKAKEDRVKYVAFKYFSEKLIGDDIFTALTAWTV